MTKIVANQCITRNRGANVKVSFELAFFEKRQIAHRDYFYNRNGSAKALQGSETVLDSSSPFQYERPGPEDAVHNLDPRSNCTKDPKAVASRGRFYSVRRSSATGFTY